MTAELSKIPFPLAQWIARVYKPSGNDVSKTEMETVGVVANTAQLSAKEGAEG